MTLFLCWNVLVINYKQRRDVITMDQNSICNWGVCKAGWYLSLEACGILQNACFYKNH